MELMQASRQWRSRPDDERFTSLVDMEKHFDRTRSESRQLVASTRRIEARPAGEDLDGLEMVVDKIEVPVNPTHHAFGQLAQLARAPAYYLRSLPSPIAADCFNYGLKFKRDVDDVGLLTHHNGADTLRAATGPHYGRIWNADVVKELVNRFGDGISGEWKVPGEFGRDVEVTKANTTLYAGDRDMFVFLADEKNRIEVPNRRGGKPGALARGFFVWNGEVGDRTFGLGTFLFDYACANRIVWGAQEYKEVRIRHTASAPDKFLSQMEPTLEAMSNASTTYITDAIEAARARKLKDDLDEFLAKRFSKGLVAPLKAIHEAEENRPIETVYDVTTAVTAYARSIQHQDRRVELERKAGELLKLAA
jgi:hypothetical protein